MHLSFEVFWWLISSNGCYFCARQRHLFRLPQHSQWQHGLFLPTRLRFQTFSGCFFRFHLQILPLHGGSRYLQALGFLQHWEDFPAGTAIELSANGKTINLLVTDLCPSSSNAHHTSKANYFFDLQKSAFTTLADESVGELQMTFKVIPYPTSKNIGFISTTTQEWYLQGRFFNMRYPLKKNRMVARWRNNIFRNVSCCLC